MPQIVLASASAARLKLLRRAGLDPLVVVSGVDEEAITAPTVPELVARLARAKAAAVAERFDDALVIGCDSLLEFAGQVQGKPASAEQATAWWQTRRGGAGTLHTGHCVIDTATGLEYVESAVTAVRFGAPSDAEVDAYVASGEPLHVAGAFTIDGLGGWFVDGLDGDVGTVLGLSLPVLRRLLMLAGYRPDELWNR
jgi:septum formation protein